MAKKKKAGRPKGSKNVVAAPSVKASVKRRGRKAKGDGIGSAFNTVMQALETLPAVSRAKVLAAVNVFLED